MTSLSLCGLSLVLVYLAARWSLSAGLLATLTVGYAYGITRANYPDGYSYFVFDAAVLGLYAGQLFRSQRRGERVKTRDLQAWIIVLVCWPLLLLLLPFQDPLIRVVGLRGSIFFLPFLLLGARLETRDLQKLAVGVAVLNLCAAVLAGVEFFVGIERFFPRNPITAIIYRSNDLLNYTAYRIPSSFPNAAAYAGTMVITMPLLIGAWQQTQGRWQRLLINAALPASALGVFMAASRSHAIVFLLIASVMVFARRLRWAYRLGWIVLLASVGWAVWSDQRLQRFTTLSDTDYVTRRVGSSVNMTFFDSISTYPLGNGLGGGGTSVPYFLQNRLGKSVAIENEYARIALEQGVPGLCFWAAFIMWVFTRPLNARQVRNEGWYLARRLAWCGCAADFALGATGTGLLTSVPQTCLMLMSMGWMVVRSPMPQGQQAIVTPLPTRPKLLAQWGTIRSYAARMAPRTVQSAR